MLLLLLWAAAAAAARRAPVRDLACCCRRARCALAALLARAAPALCIWPAFDRGRRWSLATGGPPSVAIFVAMRSGAGSARCRRLAWRGRLRPIPRGSRRRALAGDHGAPADRRRGLRSRLASSAAAGWRPRSATRLGARLAPRPAFRWPDFAARGFPACAAPRGALDPAERRARRPWSASAPGGAAAEAPMRLGGAASARCRSRGRWPTGSAVGRRPRRTLLSARPAARPAAAPASAAAFGLRANTGSAGVARHDG